MNAERAPTTTPLLAPLSLGAELGALWEERWFRFGLALRLAMAVLLVPEVQSRWFVPFLMRLLMQSDPYSAWLAGGRDPLAWPYGPAMTLAHLPTAVAGLLGAPAWVGSATFGVVLCAADVATAVALRGLASGATKNLVSKMWWLSPAAFVIGYWHGQTDAIPLALLLGTLLAFRHKRFRLGSTLAGLSIAAKLTIAFAPAFFLIWLALSRRYTGRLWDAFVPLVAVAVFGYGALLLSPGAAEMVFGSPVLGQAAALSLDLHGTPVRILPAFLIALLYVAARARRLGFDLMVGILGTALFGMAAILAVAPGWWLWALPFLGLYSAKSDRVEVTWGVWVFSALLAVETIVTASGADTAFGPLPRVAVPAAVSSVSLTLVVAVGFVLATSMFRHLLADNDPYGLAKRPLVIGLAGPSGSGKDTLSTALARVFGEREVVAVSGDDYHKWERGAPMWRVWTHLNPAANRLRQLSDDVRALTVGRSIKCRYYDHGTGRFEPRRAKHYSDIVLVSGLHTLYVPELRKALDVKIYLDMDERLRRHLKIQRDTTERGHTHDQVVQSMEQREPDLKRYIAPQSEHADLVFRLEAREPSALNGDTAGKTPLKLRATIRSGLEIEEVTRLLSAFCWCAVEVERADGSGDAIFTFEGDDATSEDIAELAELLVPNHDELVALAPHFEPGATGVMQLLVLMQTSVARHRGVRSRA